ncbi:SH3 domain-containing protein [Hymenobacter sp. BT491]|uniref:SH3 domain-containing protein n=1 Tax=Hymenobacter sp. BT491 TaxID=2766779 RepID=UPI001653E26F|nr:SH3 domain-containing protein [Hymenobacter sp. BT491]MBC6989386.1 SH3 domain-containing protein [Hymenobacter sp. BT491]
MAYVQEGLGHYPAALYYLGLAHARQPQQSTWRKMVELAQLYRLTGYPNTWRQAVAIAFQRYYYRLLQALLIGAVVVGMMLFLRRQRLSGGWWVAYSLYLGVIGLYLNLLEPEVAGIVARPRAAIMAGPSAGASWLTTAAAGDRLVVLGRQDVWYRVQWQGGDAYIRRHNLLPLR